MIRKFNSLFCLCAVAVEEALQHRTLQCGMHFYEFVLLFGLHIQRFVHFLTVGNTGLCIQFLLRFERRMMSAFFYFN